MKDKNILKSLIIIIIGLVCLIITLIVNNSLENDLLCISLMIVFILVESYGLLNIIRDKYNTR